MKYVSFLCVLFSGLLSTVALGEPDRYSHVATQAEVEQDSFLRGTALKFRKKRCGPVCYHLQNSLH